MLVGISILCFAYAPLLTFLRAPPTKEEKKVSINGIDNAGLSLESGPCSSSNAPTTNGNASPASNGKSQSNGKTANGNGTTNGVSDTPVDYRDSLNGGENYSLIVGERSSVRYVTYQNEEEDE
uniref:Uncharacterized protein n=1 Tax=Anopheles maculatus TaxID=74869 RepID=A0A182SXT1_9DIPT